MFYPAWIDLFNDNVIVDHPTALRVYARLLRDPMIFIKPKDLKAWVLADDMGVKPKTVYRAIGLLIERGYAHDHGRGVNNVRRITLAVERAEGSPEIGTPAPKGTTSSAA